jgi:serine phosphatase RsbU (regulator of sigma subunit)
MSDAAKRKILLIVDDDEGILESISMALSAEGWDCRCYASWRRASEEIPGRLRPNVALVDLNLAGDEPSDGLSAMSELLRLVPDLAIVAFTGSADYRDAARQCLAAGAVQFVRKPAAADEIHERLLHAIWIKERDVKARALERAEELAAIKAQKAFLPQEPPCVDGLRIEQFYEPTSTVLGDYFDYLLLPHTQDIVLAIGDATGHGVRAALMAHVVGGALRAIGEEAGAAFSPALALGAINRVMARPTPAGDYVTLLVMRINVQSLALTYASAGHEFPLIFRGGEATYLEQGALPLGIDPNTVYRDWTHVLRGGDLLLLVTDAVIDPLCRADQGSAKGVGRENLTRLVGDLLREGGTRGLPARLAAAVKRLTGKQSLDDDCTILSVEAMPSAASTAIA